MTEHDPRDTTGGTPLRLVDGGRRLRPDDPMDDELCLFVLGLARDGRPVPAPLLERAREWADARPAVGRADRDMALLSDVMAEEGRAVRVASPGFTGAVTAAARAPRDGGGLLRLAAAAALLLAVTVVWDGARPVATLADKGLDREPYAVDAFRPDPFGPDDVPAGLRALFPDPAPRGPGAETDPAPEEEPR